MLFGVKSDKGMVRDINEDSCNVIAGGPDMPGIYIVADGMGGHNSGEVASKMAVDFISSHILKSPDFISQQEGKSFEDDVSTAIKHLIKLANAEIYSKSVENSENYGMGTTLIVAVQHSNNLTIGHVGDSRVYRIRQDAIEQITIDHSYIEELIKNGSLKRKDADKHPKRNLLTRALGCPDNLEVDTYICSLNSNDYIVICTDGLTNMLQEDEIKDIVVSSDSPQAACDELVRHANEKGGEDNITVIVVKNV